MSVTIWLRDGITEVSDPVPKRVHCSEDERTVSMASDITGGFGLERSRSIAAGVRSSVPDNIITHRDARLDSVKQNTGGEQRL